MAEESQGEGVSEMTDHKPEFKPTAEPMRVLKTAAAFIIGIGSCLIFLALLMHEQYLLAIPFLLFTIAAVVTMPGGMTRT